MKATRPLWPSRHPSLLVSFQQAITEGIVGPFHLSEIHKQAHKHIKQWRVMHYTSLVILDIFTLKLLLQFYSIGCRFFEPKIIRMDIWCFNNAFSQHFLMFFSDKNIFWVKLVSDTRTALVLFVKSSESNTKSHWFCSQIAIEKQCDLKTGRLLKSWKSNGIIYLKNFPIGDLSISIK